MLVWQSVSYAAVSIGDNGKAPEQKKTTSIPKMGEKAARIKNRIHQLEIEGYANSVYVRFVVEITNNKLIAGQMFRGKGEAKYVYGESLDGILHLYGPNGEHFTVISP